MKSLYLHFPFCESKCHYCDFYSIGRERTRDSDASTYERAIIKEIELAAAGGLLGPQQNPLETLFLGGGTPSMTPPESMGRIFSTLFRYCSLAPDYEWTMEANPSSIELEQFKAYRDLGVNRVSMGVQSLRNDHLDILGRIHDEGQALRALETVFESGITNVSTDLLCGVPGQTIQDLESHIRALTQFPIQHLSIYLLTLPPHHKMYTDLPNEDEQLRHLLFIDEQMHALGFEHYEISNFARPGKQARHNLAYWTGASYLGLGPSAHSYDSQKRTRHKNVSSLHKYASLLGAGSSKEAPSLPIEWTEELTSAQIDLEKWMLAVRLARGFPKEWLTTQQQIQKAALLVKETLLEIHPAEPSHLRATPRGFALSDAIVKELATS